MTNSQRASITSAIAIVALGLADNRPLACDFPRVKVAGKYDRFLLLAACMKLGILGIHTYSGCISS
jgi:hypothetical protein